ncbi:unnamed protein product, partial [Prorocentrum cordatum]
MPDLSLRLPQDGASAASSVQAYILGPRRATACTTQQNLRPALGGRAPRRRRAWGGAPLRMAAALAPGAGPPCRQDCEAAEPLALLRSLAALPAGHPPAGEALRLLCVAERLAGEDRWGELEVLEHLPLGRWLIRGAHFSEDFASCRQEVVVPMDAHDVLSLHLHDSWRRHLAPRPSSTPSSTGARAWSSTRCAPLRCFRPSPRARCARRPCRRRRRWRPPWLPSSRRRRRAPRPARP